MALRPKTFDDFCGQASVIANLRVLVASAQSQGKPLAHVLLVGPAGLGKSTIGMHVLPNEMGTDTRFINCAAIEKPQQLTSVLATMKHSQILFLDELHALPTAAREHLLTAMEDQTISVAIGDPPNETVMQVKLQPFTVIGATTRQGMLDAPLRTRFQQTLRLEPYTDEEMGQVIDFHARDCEVMVHDMAMKLLAVCAKGVARNGVNLLHSTIDTDVAQGGIGRLTKEVAVQTLDRLGFHNGLSPEEQRYVRYLFKVGTAGVRAIATALDEMPQTIEEVYEPWLLRQGWIVRGPTGRSLTEEGKKQ